VSVRSFTLLEPRTLDAACDALAEHETARPIAGGTSLVIMIRQGFLTPDVLVNLSKIPDGGSIEVDETEVRFGALATISQLEDHPDVRRHLPAVAAACHVVANIRVRNVATLGGNVAHADYQADPPTALLAHDASLELRSARGRRVVPLDQFLLGLYATTLEPGEIVEAISVPVPPAMSWTYEKFKTRSSEDRPTAGVAVGLRIDGGVCAELRVAVGAATDRPVRIRDAEIAATGSTVDDVMIGEVAELVAASIDPIEDLNGDAAYKRRVVRAIVRRALERCRSEEGAQ
jgi:carbon-monoxide dehydrogenase medium subunit